MSAVSGVDYIDSTSRAGISIINVRLKLNHCKQAHYKTYDQNTKR